MIDLHTDEICWIAIVTDLERFVDACPEILDEIVFSASDNIVDPFDEASYEFA